MDSEEFRRRAASAVTLGMRLKHRLIELGRTSGRHKCPEPHADGKDHHIRVSLAGRKNHLRMQCDDPTCLMQVME